jgi:predicted kinase
MTDRTYAELRRRAAEHLRAGRPVVLDAMHGRASERAAAVAVAAERGVPCRIVELRLDDAAARSRIASREHDPHRTSDATWEVYQLQRGQFEAVSPSEGEHVVLDATRPPGALAREAAEGLPSRA